MQGSQYLRIQDRKARTRQVQFPRCGHFHWKEA